MSNISIKLNLRQLKHEIRKFQGKNDTFDCLVIPIKVNHLYSGEKGVYLDLTAIEVQNKRNESKNTHLIKQNLPKDVYNKMSDDDKKKLPILGNAIDWSKQNFEPEPQNYTMPETENNDDLPF